MSKTARFDDRVDTDPELSSGETLALLMRSLKFIGRVRVLFFYKVLFASVAILPPLILPWILKIIVDQVILQQPFQLEEVPFPPFMMPFIHLIMDMSPTGIMLSTTLLSFALLFIFGLRASGQFADLPQGHDAATQSEQAISSGSSEASGLWGTIEVLLTVRMTQRLANSLRTTLMGRLSRLEMTTLDDQRIGDSVYRVMYDAPMLPDICYKLTIAPLLLLISSALAVYIMQYSYGRVAPEIVWVATCLIPVTLLLTLPLSRIARRLHQTSRAAGAASVNSMEEGMDNIAAVQALGAMQKETERFNTKSEEAFRRHRHTVLLDAAITVIAYATITCGGVLAFILITDEVIEGGLTPGDYTAMIGILMTLMYAARSIGLYWIELQKNVAAVRRVFFFIDFTSELDRAQTPITVPQRGVYFDQVSFSYPDGRQALENVNLELPVGELVAVVGPTGAGKTTLAYMLPGYLRPSSGQIRFDDQDLSQAAVADIRDQVTYVFQEHMLLTGTIRDNLLLAKPDASEADMLEACRVAGALEFIEALPAGLDAPLGKGGNTLSVGQKQRLSIARGIVRDTPILVMDEPTAALDPRTENALVEALRETTRNRLVVVIAHRLSTIREADRIIFLDNGQVADVGDHESLMARADSLYRRYVELQAS